MGGHAYSSGKRFASCIDFLLTAACSTRPTLDIWFLHASPVAASGVRLQWVLVAAGPAASAQALVRVYPPNRVQQSSH